MRFALLFFFAASFGFARAQDVFTVPEVPVSAEAKSSAEAQTNARRQGRAAAFDILLRRLVAEEDWNYLPTLGAGRPARASEDAFGSDEAGEAFGLAKRPVTVGRSDLARLERETNVFNEKSSGTTYRARITYRFKADEVRALLQNARLPYSEEQARRALILPVLRTEQDTYLWEAKNPWARAWLERPLTNELTPMVLPRGDVADTQTITADEAAALNMAALRALAERYDGARILVALGRLREEDGQFRLYVQLIEATPPNLDGAAPSKVGTKVTEASFRASNDDFPALARRAVAATVARHSQAWKARTLIDYSRSRSFQLTAWYDGQRGWSLIQRALEDSAVVQNIEEGPFNLNNAIMDLTVVGEEGQFGLAMEQRGLEVWQDRAGRWHIAAADKARALREQDSPLTTDIDQEVNRRRGLGRFFRRDQRRQQEAPPGGADQTDDVPDLPDDLFGDN